MRLARRAVWVLAALAGGLAMLCLSALAEDENPVTLVGTVVEADWDEDGNIIAVSLVTDDEAYVIEPGGPGAELLAHAGERVEVRGSVSQGDDGWLHVTVSWYDVLADDE